LVKLLLAAPSRAKANIFGVISIATTSLTWGAIARLRCPVPAATSRTRKPLSRGKTLTHQSRMSWLESVSPLSSKLEACFENSLRIALLCLILFAQTGYPDHVRAHTIELISRKISIQRVHFKTCPCQQMFHLESEDTM